MIRLIAFSVIRVLALLGALIFGIAIASGQQIMSAADIQRIKDHLPLMEPGFVRNAATSDDCIWYDRAVMGVAFQAGAGAQWAQEFSATGRLGIASGLFQGNPNGMDEGSFPWNPVPGGTYRSANVDAVKGFVLPRQLSGEPWPVIVYESELEGLVAPRPTVTGLDWTFPIGTTFVELILVNDAKDKQHYVCVIRGRTKTEDGWAIDNLVPFRTVQELLDAVSDSSLRERLASVPARSPALRDRFPGNTAFGTSTGSALDLSATVDKLPEFPRELVAELIDTTVFRSSAGYEWKPGCYAPTTNSDFHLVPKNYDGGFIPVDSVGCTNCHKSTQISARRHNANSTKRGWVRGNKEGIISWHPFDPSLLTASPNQTVRLRDTWVKSGIVAYFDPAKHPQTIYKRFSSVSQP